MFESIRHERTENFFLRWIGNAAEHPAHWFLLKALKADDRDKIWLVNLYARPSNFLYKNFVHKWGTYYEVVLDDEDDE